MNVFILAILGLAFVGVGLLNLETAEGNHSYEQHRHSRCSSLKDQTTLWVGVSIVCSASIGLMASFCTESKTHRNADNQISWSPRACCCCSGHRRVRPLPNSEVTEPLLQDEAPDAEQTTSRQGEDYSVSGSYIENPSVPSRTENANSNEQVPAEEEVTSSRLRGTTRLLKLAGRESMYLWIGIVVLLIRLPFSLSIPNFVSATIGDLIDGDWDGAKRNILLLFLLGSGKFYAVNIQLTESERMVPKNSSIPKCSR